MTQESYLVVSQCPAIILVLRWNISTFCSRGYIIFSGIVTLSISISGTIGVTSNNFKETFTFINKEFTNLS